MDLNFARFFVQFLGGSSVTPNPKTETVGPWCPRNISDSEVKGGIWLEEKRVHNVDGLFIKNLNAFYEDDTWQLYDEETGEVYVTDSKEACAAAARPDVDERYQNYCVQCEISYLDEVQEITYVIPVEPVVSDDKQRINPQNGVGISFNGVRFDGPAPVSAILDAYTLAPFDDCGGHVNLHVGYHYHAVTDCIEKVGNEHAGIIGLALDGYNIHTQENLDGTKPADLDECNGHIIEGIGYHYHAGNAGSNQILGCYQGEYGCVLENSDDVCDASVQQRRPQPPGNLGAPPRPDFAQAAAQLGVTEVDLIAALGGPPPNFAAAAQTLGVSIEQLMQALPPPPRPR